MSLIAQETLEQIAAANDIVEVIGNYFPLKRAGANYRALCPFHQEKTPSFNVNPQRQIYHCFGCGATGAVFQFVMAYENTDFPTAVRKLADRAGIKIVEQELSPGDDRRHQLRGRLLALHYDAAEWFHRNLLKTAAAQAARDYLKGRGIGSDVAQSWKIGYAPDSWDAFTNWAGGKGYTGEELIQSGLAKPRDEEKPEDGIFDRFRNRILFPICNDLGEVIAFSGRTLQPDAKTAKYVNSPETMLFTKGSVLFGLHRTKRALIEKNSAIVLEGQIDLITAFEAGIDNVIAPQGTAFTEKQARILKRFVEEAVLCFDADSAGEKATERSVATLLEMNFFIRVAQMPPGNDPDSLIRQEGAAVFAERIRDAKDFFEFQLDGYGGEMNVRQKIDAGRKMAGFVSLITEPLLRETVANRVAARIGLSRDDFQKTLASAKKKPRETASAPVERPGAAVWILCILAFRHKASREWLLRQNWRELLDRSSDSRLLKLALGSDLDPESPASVSAFLAGLEQNDEAIFSAMLVEKVPEKPGVAADYWIPFEIEELRRRELSVQQELARSIQGMPAGEIEKLHYDLLCAQRRTVEAELKTPSLRQEQKGILIQKTKQILTLQLGSLRRRMERPGEGKSLEKEVLDLQHRLNDIARPSSFDS